MNFQTGCDYPKDNDFSTNHILNLTTHDSSSTTRMIQDHKISPCIFDAPSYHNTRSHFFYAQKPCDMGCQAQKWQSHFLPTNNNFSASEKSNKDQYLIKKLVFVAISLFQTLSDINPQLGFQAHTWK